MALIEKLSAIGQAIRDMTGKTEMLTLDDMPGEIRSIEGGGGSSADVRYVTFMSYDGTEEYIRLPVAVGYDCPEPKIETPTRESTAQYNYTFAGWATTVNGALDSNTLKAVTEDRTVYANYISVIRYYTITFYDSDGTTVLKTESLAYGATPSYTPEKSGYSFDGWEPELATVTDDATYQAKWIEEITFAKSGWGDIVRIAESGEAKNYFKVGDQRTITVGSYGDIKIAIAGFDHDDLESGSGKAAMSIVCLSVPNLQVTWHSGKSTYANANIRKSTLSTTLYNLLPETLRPHIKSVKKKYDAGYSNGADPILYETNDKLWLLSMDELGATWTASGSLAKYSKLGTKYEIFSDITGFDFPIMNVGIGTTPVEYFVRTLDRVGVCRPGYVTVLGGLSSIQDSAISTTQKYVCFGFCI